MKGEEGTGVLFDTIVRDVVESQQHLSPMGRKQAAQELYYWQNPGPGGATNFHSMLFVLIGKADKWNRFKLGLGFPTEVSVWEEWQASDEREFFRKYGVAQ